MISLVLDASTYRATVAVLRDSEVLAQGEAAMRRGGSEELLMPSVADALSRSGVSAGELDRVICGAGPGSFTSLRIAAGIAKGLTSAMAIPLYAVPSLALAVAAVRGVAGRYCAALDALRGDVYVGLYEVSSEGDVDEIESATIIAAADLDAFAAARGAKPLLVGVSDGHASAWPRASAVVAALRLVERRGEVDRAAWEPRYGRLAEAQVKWEAAHGGPMAAPRS